MIELMNIIRHLSLSYIRVLRIISEHIDQLQRCVLPLCQYGAKRPIPHSQSQMKPLPILCVCLWPLFLPILPCRCLRKSVFFCHIWSLGSTPSKQADTQRGRKEVDKQADILACQPFGSFAICQYTSVKEVFSRKEKHYLSGDHTIKEQGGKEVVKRRGVLKRM